jgi:hypothetical protein
MAKQEDMWGRVKSHYNVCATEPAAESVAGFLIEKHAEHFELDGTGERIPLEGWTYALGMSPVVDFVVAVALATQESKALSESADDYVLRLQNRLMDKKLYKPR